jgi:predicted small secreted protein
MKKIIGIVLILIAVGLGYTGINTVNKSGESVEVIGIELSAADEDKKTKGYVYIGLAVVSLIGGVTLFGKS